MYYYFYILSFCFLLTPFYANAMESTQEASPHKTTARPQILHDLTGPLFGEENIYVKAAKKLGRNPSIKEDPLGRQTTHLSENEELFLFREIGKVAIEGIDLNNSMFSNEYLQKLTRFIRTHEKLESLVLMEWSFAKSPRGNLSTLIELVEEIQILPYLKNFSIERSSNIDDETMKLFLPILKKPALKTFDILGSSITPKGLRALGEALEGNNTLEYLDLKSNSESSQKLKKHIYAPSEIEDFKAFHHAVHKTKIKRSQLLGFFVPEEVINEMEKYEYNIIEYDSKLNISFPQVVQFIYFF